MIKRSLVIIVVAKKFGTTTTNMFYIQVVFYINNFSKITDSTNLLLENGNVSGGNSVK